jgi:UDP-glucose 4-epimerase
MLLDADSVRGVACIVTGGAGAIGSRLVAKLLRLGAASVHVVDDLSSGHLWLLPDDRRVSFVRGDVCRLEELGVAVERPLVFHLAAFFANQNSVDHPQDDLKTNGFGTLSTLIWAARRSAQRVVYASAGCSIAGHGIDGPISEDLPVSLDLDTPYQITKALGEFYCNYFDQQVSTVRCRFFNSYGPGEVPGKYRNVIPNFIWCALRNEPLMITGTGGETRDFIYVDDLTDGLIAAAVAPAAGGQAINLGTGLQTRILDLARMVIERCSSRSSIEFVARRPWDMSLHREADISRARLLLDFSPRVSLRNGIDRTISWFTEHYERIGSSIGKSK